MSYMFILTLGLMNALPLARSGMRVIGQSVSAPYSQEKVLLTGKLTVDGNSEKNNQNLAKQCFGFVAWLRKFFTRWTGVAKCEKSFDGLSDLLI